MIDFNDAKRNAAERIDALRGASLTLLKFRSA